MKNGGAYPIKNNLYYFDRARRCITSTDLLVLNVTRRVGPDFLSTRIVKIFSLKNSDEMKGPAKVFPFSDYKTHPNISRAEK